MYTHTYSVRIHKRIEYTYELRMAMRQCGIQSCQHAESHEIIVKYCIRLHVL